MSEGGAQARNLAKQPQPAVKLSNPLAPLLFGLDRPMTGAGLRQLRLGLGTHFGRKITQVEFADAIGIRADHLCRLERGPEPIPPRISLLARLVAGEVHRILSPQ